MEMIPTTTITTFPSSSSSSLSPEGYYTSAAVLFVIALLGFVNNMAVFCVVGRNRNLRTPLNYLLVNLGVSDMGISVVGAPVSMCAALMGGWQFSEGVCVTYAFLMSLFGITSITTLTILSLERWLIITRPLQAQKLTKARATWTVLGIWLFSLLLTAPPLVGWGHYGIEGPGISCSVDWEVKSSLNSTYIMFLFTFGLGVPLLIMAVSYLSILIRLRQHTSTTTTTTTTTTRAEKRVAVMVLVMAVTFLIAWLPYAVMALVVVAYSNSSSGGGGGGTVGPVVAVFPAIFAKTSCIYNPVIYVGLNTQFRSAWLELIRCKQTDRHTQVHTTEKVSISNYSEQQQQQPQQQQQQQQQQLQQLQLQQKQLQLMVDYDGKNHLAVPMREFKTSSLSSSEATSVSEMV